MSNEDYWKQVCKEYERVLKMKDNEISNLREENFQSKHKKVSIMDTLIGFMSKNEPIETLILMLSNGEEITFKYIQSNIDVYDDYLLILRKGDFNIYIDVNEIIGLKTIMRG